jgi:hypothetical protein
MTIPPLAKKFSKILFKIYIAWSICADILLIGGIVALLLGYGQITF